MIDTRPFHLQLSGHHGYLLLNLVNLALEDDCAIEFPEFHKVVRRAALGRNRTGDDAWLVASIGRVEVEVLIRYVSREHNHGPLQLRSHLVVVHAKLLNPDILIGLLLVAVIVLAVNRL